MALGYHGGETLKLSGGELYNGSGKVVMIEFDKCEFCGNDFIGTEHNDPGENPIELAISDCGNCIDVPF